MPHAPHPGRVILIGAGPGDPELLTIRGLRYLASADVVLYDRLVDDRLLHYVPSSARVVYVGKQPGQSSSQAWIQRLMIREARKGLRVVRLKSGDPFVFGRGGEEIEALARAGVAYEVVPGVSSALAVPAMAGIPVLHRDYANSLALVSGHRCSPDDIALWTTWLHQSGTLVILMGMANLASIATALQHKGVPPQMPVAVTMAGTHRDEQTVLGTLADIADAARELSAPAVIVIGHVVACKRVCEQWSDGMEPPTFPVLASLP